MKATWASGKLSLSPQHSVNRSKIEDQFFQAIKAVYPDISRGTIRLGKRWFFPDVLAPHDGVVIEFYGDFWHANPQRYAYGDIVNHTTAAAIWRRDAERVEAIESLGYQVIIVWESDYKSDRLATVKHIDNLLNWDSCSL
jgi:hypothetical protein